MKSPPIPNDESARLKELGKLGVIYTPREHRFDRITALACQIFNVPMSFVSLVAGDCQWFKSVQGLTIDSTSREVSFCAHAILQAKPFIVEDTLKNPDFADNPLVTGPPYIRFYAGAQLITSTHTSHSTSIGTLCIIDIKPRFFSHAEKESLESLARWVENEIKNPVLIQEEIDDLINQDEEKRRNMLDPITGCWNAGATPEILEKSLEKARHKGCSVNAIKINVTNYQEIVRNNSQNDIDFFMKHSAHTIRSLLRRVDSVFRTSPSEFLAFLADCPPEMIDELSVQIVNLINKGNVKLNNRATITDIKVEKLSFKTADNLRASDIIG